MCDTHGFTTAVGKIYPAHCRAPAISEADLTISAATDLIKTMRGKVPATATKKQQHAKILKQLLSILKNSKPLRVADGGQSRVSPAASTSSDATLPTLITNTRFVHQRRTRNNTPLPSIQDEDDVTEATPVRQVQDHDGIADGRQDEEDEPIPHYVKDVQEMLRARSAAQPVGPVRKNAVRQSKKA